GRVGAHAEEGRVPEGDLPREAAQHVPRRAKQRPEQHGDAEVEKELVRRHEGRREHQEQQREHSGGAIHSRPTPQSPEGRKSRTSRKMTKPMVSLEGTEEETAPRGSPNPSRIPPPRAAETGPAPPSTPVRQP